MANHFRQEGAPGKRAGTSGRLSAARRDDAARPASPESTEGWLALGRALSDLVPTTDSGTEAGDARADWPADTSPDARLHPLESDLPTIQEGGAVASGEDDSWAAPLPVGTYPAQPEGAAAPNDAAVPGATFAERGVRASAADGARASAHGSSPAVTGAFARLDPSVTGSFAAITPESLQPLAVPAAAAQDAPRPIGVDPSVTGGFSRIAPDQAARSVTRENAPAAAQAARAGRIASHAPRRMRRDALPKTASHQPRLHGSRRAFVALALAAVIVVLAVGTLVFRALNSAADAASGATSGDAPVEVAAADAISYAGSTYALVAQPDGTHLLTAQPDGASDIAEIAVIGGVPSRLIGYGGAIIIPESFADEHWDIIAYTPGEGSMVTQVVNADGEAVHGSGAVVEASIVDDALVITDSTGATTTIPLA